jgi:hypothetical protein
MKNEHTIFAIMTTPYRTLRLVLNCSTANLDPCGTSTTESPKYKYLHDRTGLNLRSCGERSLAYLVALGKPNASTAFAIHSLEW